MDVANRMFFDCEHHFSIHAPLRNKINLYREWATACNAQITTIDQNFNLIGSTLAETLLDPDYKPGNHTIPVQLIPRASTGEVRR